MFFGGTDSQVEIEQSLNALPHGTFCRLNSRRSVSPNMMNMFAFI